MRHGFIRSGGKARLPITGKQATNSGNTTGTDCADYALITKFEKIIVDVLASLVLVLLLPRNKKQLAGTTSFS
jgi:hypothetical protein